MMQTTAWMLVPLAFIAGFAAALLFANRILRRAYAHSASHNKEIIELTKLNATMRADLANSNRTWEMVRGLRRAPETTL